jgi:hypothetical protein
MKAKNANTGPGPIQLKRKGTVDGMMAASTQWVELPNACPELLRWFGNISDMNTQITAPCPMACDAMNRNRKMGTDMPCHPRKKAVATRESEMM